MNHIYRLVWNQVRRTWQVVSELALGRGKAERTSTSHRTRSAWWIAFPLSLPMLALATAPTVIAPVVSSTHPTGGQVTAGSGRIDYGDHLTTIQQNSQNLSLNWQSFNIGADSTVNFVQPNAQSIAVNRIADPNGSVILGHLNANGQVFLINPNGVLFGQGAQVNVGGLVASTLDVSDSELGAGTLHFAGAGNGSVTNRGTLTAAPGGYVALLGHAVSNQGAIHAPAGSVALAGGSAVTLSFDGNHLLDMQIDASTLNALAENKQLIVADGGQVLMSAGAKNSLLASVVNNTGTIQAQTVANHAGKIVLLGGMAAGTTHVAGTLDASAPNGGDGGFIETSAAHVQVADGTKITTLAAAGNAGIWLIDPHDFTIGGSRGGTVAGGVPSGDISGATLSTALGSGNVTILSSQGSKASGSGNIYVNDAVSWGANTLTLTAAHDVDINAVMTASGSAGLALNTATANGGEAAVAGGTVNVMPGEGGRVDFTGSSNTLKINNQSYTIITALGAAGSATGTDLQGIKGGLGGRYALGANIDASATANWNGNAGFAPIGDTSTNFTGIFDGLGHTISGLTIDRPSTDYVGLFGYAGTGSAIRNLGLLGGSVKGNNSVGGLVGETYIYATISQVYSTAAVNGSGYNVGGLVGNNHFGMISQAYANGAVSGGSRVGGLVGENSGRISQVYATGAVSGSYYVGGLVGENNVTISQAYATGAVSGIGPGSGAGGLVGSNNDGTISQAYATGAVSSTGNYLNIGGLVGENRAAISQVYATGAVSGTGNYVGGLVGHNYGWYATISHGYWDTETSGQPAGCGGDSCGGGVTGLTTAALIAAMPGGFSTAAWGNGDNQTTPYLWGLSGNQVFGKYRLPSTINVTNRPGFYTVILDVNALQAVGAGLSGRYVLGDDIDASATIDWNDGAGFAPIGNPTRPFLGIFDGLGHAISGLTIDRLDAEYVGLFGYIGNGGMIRNVGLLGGSVTGRHYTGGLAARNDGTISGAYATGSVTGGYVPGVYEGAFGMVGGLVGYNSGLISQAYATGAVNSHFFGGGLVGCNVGTISQGYATGTVSGTGPYLGGLVGYNNYAGPNNFPYATATINQTYATGAVSGPGPYIGGLVGLNIDGAVNGSYWDTATTGQLTSDGGAGLTTAQMMDPASFAGWDIATAAGGTSVWRIYAGHTAPLLPALITSPVVGGVGGGQGSNDSASTVATAIVAGLQQDELTADDGAATLHAPDIRIVGAGVRLP